MSIVDWLFSKKEKKTSIAHMMTVRDRTFPKLRYSIRIYGHVDDSTCELSVWKFCFANPLIIRFWDTEDCMAGNAVEKMMGSEVCLMRISILDHQGALMLRRHNYVRLISKRQTMDKSQGGTIGFSTVMEFDVI